MTNDSGLIPMEFNVVVQMDPTEETTAGGIILPTTKRERDELATDEGTLIAASPHAFTYAEWPAGARPPLLGDRVMFAQYAGRIWERGGVKYRILKDKDIVAVIEQPATLAAAA
jgi:chaperonin GroES